MWVTQNARPKCMLRTHRILEPLDVDYMDKVGTKVIYLSTHSKMKRKQFNIVDLSQSQCMLILPYANNLLTHLAYGQITTSTQGHRILIIIVNPSIRVEINGKRIYSSYLHSRINRTICCMHINEAHYNMLFCIP